MVWDPSASTNVPGTPGECASYTDIPSSAPIVTIAEGGGIIWNVADVVTSAATVTGFYSNIPQVKKWVNNTTFNKFGLPQSGLIFVIFAGSGSAIKAWCVSAWDPGSLWLSAYATDPFTLGTSMVIDQKFDFQGVDNTPYEVGLSLSQSGTTTNWRLFTRVLGTNTGQFLTGSKTSNSNGSAVTEIQIAAHGDSAGLVTGQFVLRNTAEDLEDDNASGNGYITDTHHARLSWIRNI